ncbi:MAG: 3-phosphoserine/phosphohydroxythreonine transaminase [Flavobacteriales bacterium]|nr:3-phosphoserine/phosphohydroxythreonine transaminase [Flavobacteriales bacterium]
MSKVHNFSAGPCILAPEVIEGAAKAVKELDNIGLSLIEISHRSKEFIAIMDEAQNLVREILDVPSNYSILFLQGGASLGFYMTALNFMKEGGTAGYLNTGAWSKKAIKEAKMVGNVEVVASSEDANFNYIPKEYPVSTSWNYLHLTSNNTIFGTQIKNFPVSKIPVICDMSSDILSRKINVADFDMIYAGAQKNMGPAGTTLYIIKNDFLGKSGRAIPSMLDLGIHADKGSMFNTPPVFAIYTCMLTLKWVKENGGLAAMEKRNEDKAALLYNTIDSNPLFEGTAAKEDRSNMNVTFVLTDDTNKDEFDKMWNKAGISGVKGHRDVGGYRASIYNAMPKESIQVLVDVMNEFANKFA